MTAYETAVAAAKAIDGKKGKSFEKRAEFMLCSR